MATEEDNFDIDIYGDGGEDYQEEGQVEPEEENQTVLEPPQLPESGVPSPANFVDSAEAMANGHDESRNESKAQGEHDLNGIVAHKIGSTDDSTLDPLHLPKQAPQTQGLKRKEGVDERFVDPGATTALFISDLHWWITDDDIRGWANQSECEDELEDITFSEHKVNGKSKGQAYVLFKSPQAATAARHKVESFSEGQKYRQKFTVSYTNPYTNPFKTLPKDGPMRNGNQGNRSASGGYSNSPGMGGPPAQQSGYNPSGGYRGRGGYNRGSVSNVGGYNRGGYQQSMSGNFQTPPMSAFQAPSMGGMPSYGGFPNRGAMVGGMRGTPIGMRGGRGGMNSNSMMGMQMGGMNIGGMPTQMAGMGMNMGMPQIGAGMGMQVIPAAVIKRRALVDSTLRCKLFNTGSPGFQGTQSHYNPAFFQQQGAQSGGMGDSSWNPHGAKRTRQESQASAIFSLRRHPNWLLTTLILASVAVGNALPLTLNHLFAVGAVTPFIVSTILVALLGNLIPQAIVPLYMLGVASRMTWFMRALMLLTAPLSVPLGWVFRFCKVWGKRHQRWRTDGILDSEELAEFLRLHQASAGLGGGLNDEVGGLVSRLLAAEKLSVGKATGRPLLSIYQDSVVDTSMLEQMFLVKCGFLVVSGSDGVLGVVTREKIQEHLPLGAPIPIRNLPIDAVPVVTEDSRLMALAEWFAGSDERTAIVVSPSADIACGSEGISWTSGGLLGTRPQGPITTKRISVLGVITAHHFLSRLFSGQNDWRPSLSYQDPSSYGASSAESSDATLSVQRSVFRHGIPNELIALGGLRKRSNTLRTTSDHRVGVGQPCATTTQVLESPEIFASNYAFLDGSIEHTPCHPSPAVVCHSADAPSFSRGRRLRFSPLSSIFNLQNSFDSGKDSKVDAMYTVTREEIASKADKRQDSLTDANDDDDVAYEIINSVDC
ncbi:hypothetical protein MMC13_002094 [Lambiella insularis]|nr:hypothetical protein [Lambiella insularis]